MRMRHGVQRGRKRRKDNAEAQSARRSAEETRRGEEQKKIELGKTPKWNG
jgi:hypothetical protein